MLNSRVKQTLLLNYITQDNNKVMEDDSNKIIKFHRLEIIIKEAMSTFHSVARVVKRNGRSQIKRPLP